MHDMVIVLENRGKEKVEREGCWLRRFKLFYKLSGGNNS